VVYCPVIDFINNEYYTLTDQINRDEVTPAEAAAELESRCQQEYDAGGFS
jgi:hypothetical protein